MVQQSWMAVSCQASNSVTNGGFLAQAAQALRAACERFLLSQMPPEHHADAAAAAGELGALPAAGGTMDVDDQGRGSPAGDQHRGAEDAHDEASADDAQGAGAAQPALVRKAVSKQYGKCACEGADTSAMRLPVQAPLHQCIAAIMGASLL